MRLENGTTVLYYTWAPAPGTSGKKEQLKPRSQRVGKKASGKFALARKAVPRRWAKGGPRSKLSKRNKGGEKHKKAPVSNSNITTQSHAPF